MKDTVEEKAQRVWNNVILRCGKDNTYPKVLARTDGSLIIADDKTVCEYIQPLLGTDEIKELRNCIGFYTPVEKKYFSRATYTVRVPLATKYHIMQMFIDLYCIRDNQFSDKEDLDTSCIEVLSLFGNEILENLHQKLEEITPVPEVEEKSIDEILLAKCRCIARSEIGPIDRLLDFLHIRSIDKVIEVRTIELIADELEDRSPKPSDTDSNTSITYVGPYKYQFNEPITKEYREAVQQLSRINLIDIVMAAFKSKIYENAMKNSSVTKLLKDVFIVVSIDK